MSDTPTEFDDGHDIDADIVKAIDALAVCVPEQRGKFRVAALTLLRQRAFASRRDATDDRERCARVAERFTEARGPTGCLIPGEAGPMPDTAMNGFRAAQALLIQEARRLWDEERKFSGDLASMASWGLTNSADFLRDNERRALGDLGNTGGRYASPS